MAVKNLTFGAREPVANLEIALQQLRDANRYRNKLVELDRSRRDACNEAIRRDFPRLLVLDAAITAKKAEIDAIYSEIKAGNVQNRKRTASDEQKHKIAVLKADLRELRADHKALSDEAYRDKQSLACIKESHKTASKKAYDESRIYWGTRLLVREAAESFGKGAPPRFLRYDGNGSLGVQIQHGIPFADLLAGKADRRIQLHRRGDRHYDLWFRVDSDVKGGPVWCVLPITLKPEPPAGAIIKFVRVMRRVHGREFRVGDSLHVHGGRVEWSVMFTCNVPAGAMAERGGDVGIDVGWRRFPRDGLRVAVAVGSDGKRHELRLSEKMMTAVDKARSIQGFRDKNLETIRSFLLDIKKMPSVLPEWFTDRCKTLHLWKSPNSLARLIVEWRKNRFAGDRVAFEIAEAWRNRDGHLGRYASGLLNKMSAERKVLYRKWAHDLAACYSTACIEKMDLRKFSQSPEPDDTDGSSSKFRSNKSLANISFLRQCLKEKMQVIEVHSRLTTKECHLCHARNDFSGEIVIHTCTSCGQTWDREDNAARNILARGMAVKNHQDSLATKTAKGDSSESIAPVKLSRSARFAAARKSKREANPVKGLA